ncbi:hypothetical protein [Niallia sp. 01092]|uniref:hypothetical protein n=1 Tax=unclassified Niallia TaxID=2837522 RepID=UPI003FD2EDB2
MSRLFSIILIGLGGYVLIKKRYRIMNMVLKNSLIRQYLIKFVMNLPGIRDKMMSTVFSRPTSY